MKKNFICTFFQFLIINNLDLYPYPDSLEMQDPDPYPDSMIPDPQHFLKLSV
jgi:hypothetical protein